MDFGAYGTWDPLGGCKILPLDVGIISLPAESFFKTSIVFVKCVLIFCKTAKGSDLYSLDFGIWQDAQCWQAHHRMCIAR